MADQVKQFTIEDAEIIFRNFAGREMPFNAEGKRNFAVVLDTEVAQQMFEDGWNVKTLEAKEEGEEDRLIVKVEVKFDIRPPRIVLITTTSRTALTEKMVEVLDFADIETVDIIATGYDWEVGPKSGTKAYLKTMFVTIREDELERKYKINEIPPQTID